MYKNPRINWCRILSINSMFGRFCFRVAPFRDVKPLAGCPEISQTRRQWFWGAWGKLDLGKPYWTLLGSCEWCKTNARNSAWEVCEQFTGPWVCCSIIVNMFFQLLYSNDVFFWKGRRHGVIRGSSISFDCIYLFFVCQLKQFQIHDGPGALGKENVHDWYTGFLVSNYTRLTHCKISRKSSHSFIP